MDDTKELALGYTRASDTQFNAGLFLLRKLAITSGMRACSTSANLTAHIADNLVSGPSSSVPTTPNYEQSVRNNLSFFQGRAEDLSSFPADSFDVVFINSTLHWVHDQPAAVTEFARVLAPGGKLGVSGGSGDFVTAQERVKADEAPPRFLRRSEMERLLDNARFKREREIVVNKIVKEAKDADAKDADAKDADVMIDWLDVSSSGKTYGGIPLDLKPRAREEKKRGWEKIADGETGKVRMEMELLVTVAVV
ncbi:S-adenosyl-L-methionine-dependent methyltransferase [Apodospora peruviana]|uniref:S-adenosyl-L-methionine-dependent methyltransferase n=1 Tax=Apodospora peruviana TaxID=516989 RepID=A0AAE0I5K8_9PEZI|nr:S-adenosyl-L-methionine-dependent methyltransferase [Apodospora peruviana]